MTKILKWLFLTVNGQGLIILLMALIIAGLLERI
jgi:hypothetical protein